jgi:hypothetical protein
MRAVHLCLIILLGSLCLGRVAAVEEEPVKLNKTVRCSTLAEARGSLTDRLLTPPVRLGAKREEIRAKLGSPKEIIGFGNELYKVKDAMVMVSYTSDDNGDQIANLVELHPNREISWSNWLKPSVQLPRPSLRDIKPKSVSITLQIRIEDIGDNRGLHLTLIGDQEAVSFIHWSLIL